MYFADGCGTEAPNIHVMPDGHAVARSSDFIVFSVEAEFIEKVVAEYGPCMFFPPVTHFTFHSKILRLDHQ